jgi:hypothetical protein
MMPDINRSREILQEKLDRGWLDERTRMVTVSFTLWNTGANKWASITLSAEFGSIGPGRTSSAIYIQKGLRYRGIAASVNEIASRSLTDTAAGIYGSVYPVLFHHLCRVDQSDIQDHSKEVCSIASGIEGLIVFKVELFQKHLELVRTNIDDYVLCHHHTRARLYRVRRFACLRRKMMIEQLHVHWNESIATIY